jgi:hypothetical protein
MDRIPKILNIMWSVDATLNFFLSIDLSPGYQLTSGTEEFYVRCVIPPCDEKLPTEMEFAASVLLKFWPKDPMTQIQNTVVLRDKKFFTYSLP